MLSNTNCPSTIFTKLASKPGTYENFILHADRLVQSVENGKEFVAASKTNFGRLKWPYPDWELS